MLIPELFSQWLKEEHPRSASRWGRGLSKVSFGSGVVLWLVLLITWNWEPNDGPLQQFVLWFILLTTIITFFGGLFAFRLLSGSKGGLQQAADRRSRLVARIAALLGLLLGAGGLFVVFSASNS